MDDDRKIKTASCAITGDLLDAIDDLVERKRRERREFVSRSAVLRDLIVDGLDVERRRAA